MKTFDKRSSDASPLANREESPTADRASLSAPVIQSGLSPPALLNAALTPRLGIGSKKAFKRATELVDCVHLLAREASLYIFMTLRIPQKELPPW